MILSIRWLRREKVEEYVLQHSFTSTISLLYSLLCNTLGSTSVRIIPPLRGLERVFCCSWCQFNLFNLASVIRTDLDLRPLRAMLQPRHNSAADEKSSAGGTGGGNRINTFSGSKEEESLEYGGGGEGSKQGGESQSMPAPSLTMSRGSSSGNMSPPIAPPKPVYREPPKTMRNRDSKSFDFGGFGASPTSNSNSSQSLSTRQAKALDEEDEGQEEEDSKMDVDSGDMDEDSNCNSSGVGGSVKVPMLSIDPGGGNASRVASARGGFGGGGGDGCGGGKSSVNNSPSVPPRHGSSSARSLQVSMWVKMVNCMKKTLFPHRASLVFSLTSLSDLCLSLSLSFSHSVYVDQIQPSHTSSSLPSPLESPRIPLPPHKVERSSFAYPSPRDRPQSAEKTRWLARVNLLGEGAGGEAGWGASSRSGQGQGRQGHKGRGELIDKMSQDDDEAIKLGFGREKYIHIEYLEWMGDELLSGDIDEVGGQAD